MSFPAPKSETPSKRLVPYTGPINHCARRTGLLEWNTPMVGEMSVCGVFRQKPTQMLKKRLGEMTENTLAEE